MQYAGGELSMPPTAIGSCGVETPNSLRPVELVYLRPAIGVAWDMVLVGTFEFVFDGLLRGS